MTGFRIFAAGISLAVATGCGGSAGGVVPDGPFGAVTRAVHRDRGASWMDHDAVSRARLLYVTDVLDGDVYVLSLPTGKLVGKLTGFNRPTGDCVDGQGNVFVADSQDGSIREFHHGAKEPSNVLNDSGYTPLGCSVDPVSGNLAVTNSTGNRNRSGAGNVAIYKKAKGAPRYYSDKSIKEYGFCAYDTLGNLYFNAATPVLLAELPRAAKTFVRLNLDHGNGEAEGAMQWDGKHLAIGIGTRTIYEYAIQGDKGIETGSTQLGNSTSVLGFWISGARVYAPVYENSLGSVGVYRYPAGGKAKQQYYAVINPWSATLSVKQESQRSGAHL
ncbi:MAG: hypothetical protein WAJ94_07305 [Candidatus Cybelea sp.]